MNLQAASLEINFVSFFPTLSAEDLAGINLLIRNALYTSFLPSTEKLPDQIAYLHIRPLLGPPSVIAVPIKMANPDPTVFVGDGNPATVNNIFLKAGNDDFAFAVGRDFLVASFNAMVSKGLNVRPFSVTQWPFGTATYNPSTQPFAIDPNKFVLLNEGLVSGGAIAYAGVVSGTVSGYTPLCLTVRGARLPSSGSGVPQDVSGSVCGYNRFPIINGVKVAGSEAVAMVALTQAGPDGMVQAMGHTPAHVDMGGRNTPNVLAYFEGSSGAGNLETLTQALRDSRRTDVTTAIVAVLSYEQLTKMRFTAGVVYADSNGGAWERVYGVKRTQRSVTLIADPKGHVRWHHEGEIDSKTLAAALKQHLAVGGPVRAEMLVSNLRLGRVAPDFQFQVEPGHVLTLRKAGADILVFWRSDLPLSIEAVRDLQAKSPGQRPVVLAINIGEKPELAQSVAKKNGFTATLVVDPERLISVAYGISALPASVLLNNKSGAVTAIRFGRFALGAAATGQRAGA